MRPREPSPSRARAFPRSRAPPSSLLLSPRPRSQEFFQSKGWENKPIRCEACRKIKKQQQEQRDGGGRGGYQQGGFGGQGAFGGGAFGSRQGGAQQGGRSCYNCGKVSPRRSAAPAPLPAR